MAHTDRVIELLRKRFPGRWRYDPKRAEWRGTGRRAIVVGQPTWSPDGYGVEWDPEVYVYGPSRDGLAEPVAVCKLTLRRPKVR